MRPNRPLRLLALLGAAATTASSASVALAPREDATYDYIVVGSGPGGGPLASNLARAGFETLLIEAGDNEIADPATNVASFFATTGIKESLHWDFYVKHYDDLEQTKKFQHLVWRLPDGSQWVGPGGSEPEGAEVLGVNYPRGATLGGSSVINAGAVLLPNDSDWNYVKNITGDGTWSAANMRRIFAKLERNTYLPEGTEGHGFDGYVDVTIGDGNQYLSSPQAVEIMTAMAEELGKDPADLPTLLTADANYLDPERDFTEGLWALPFHVNETWGRVSARNYILSTFNARDKGACTKKYPLHLQLNTLATRVLFSHPSESESDQPRAVGVEFLEGKSVYQGDRRHDPSSKGTPGRAYARREVILSGGAFNTPQLLKLSGIGDAAELAQHGIDVVAPLPGVGTNMQDSQEIAITGLAAQNFTFADPPSGPDPTCRRDGAPGDDPCYDLWLQGKGPYARAGPNTSAFLLRSNHSADGERDLTIFAGPFAFRGFWPATGQEFREPPNTWGMHMVKMRPQNRRGVVKLRSADPTEMPEINFHLFAEGADVDIGAIKDGVAWGRRAFGRVRGGAAPVEITHPPCAAGPNPDGSCADPEADEAWIRDDAFGHHVTSTCPIGADDDEMAVLDSEFRVRGVRGLRVVDASVFPRTPGSFPVIATFMVSEKASEVILGQA
ncbi:alcohol oxidase [Sodiomyces alkalinus F11]|uniref:Alcohol oxidase n=1 Tax=Sodiomyces alkalinus (strain CBS 110278 / VKM F-3762 / F11) TaxID=1314773 RepID=A0A3N2PQY4_SODAK|nr:alcohol oxidase [Sodiomyces alkalinus F11]ROT36766.1 alcohol oxidase [Sodiomyces alkalinus F11]